MSIAVCAWKTETLPFRRPKPFCKSSFTGILKEQRSDLGILIDVDKITAELGGNAFAGGVLLHSAHSWKVLDSSQKRKLSSPVLPWRFFATVNVTSDGKPSALVPV